jgi:hypothetical protein
MNNQECPLDYCDSIPSTVGTVMNNQDCPLDLWQYPLDCWDSHEQPGLLDY